MCNLMQIWWLSILNRIEINVRRQTYVLVTLTRTRRVTPTYAKTSRRCTPTPIHQREFFLTPKIFTKPTWIPHWRRDSITHCWLKTYHFNIFNDIRKDYQMKIFKSMTKKMCILICAGHASRLLTSGKPYALVWTISLPVKVNVISIWYLVTRHHLLSNRIVITRMYISNEVTFKPQHLSLSFLNSMLFLASSEKSERNGQPVLRY